MKKIVTLFMLSLFMVICSLPTDAKSTTNIWTSNEEDAPEGGTVIDSNGNKTIWQSNPITNQKEYQMSSAFDSVFSTTTRTSGSPTVSTASNGATVTHYSWWDHDTDIGLDRAAAWTEMKYYHGQLVYHYTRTQIITTMGGDLRDDSGRIWGYTRTYAYTGYCNKNDGFSMRSYWGY